MPQETNRDGLEYDAQRQGRYSNKKPVRQKKQRKTQIAIRIGLCVCAIGFVIGAILFGKTLLEDKQADAAYVTLRMEMQQNVYAHSVSDEALTAPIETPAPEDGEIAAKRGSEMNFAQLKEINQEIVAWLLCEGTAIDYPVLHTNNNDYYLSHLYTKEANRMGSLFVDERNTGLFTDQNTVIYGHNMKSGAMFHSLAEYKQQDYYDAHPTMRLYTPDGDYAVELFSGTIEDGNFEFVEFNFASDEDFLNYVERIRARSTFTSNVVIEPTDRIVSLCTCSYERNNARYMLLGKLTSVA